MAKIKKQVKFNEKFKKTAKEWGDNFIKLSVEKELWVRRLYHGGNLNYRDSKAIIDRIIELTDQLRSAWREAVKTLVVNVDELAEFVDKASDISTEIEWFAASSPWFSITVAGEVDEAGSTTCAQSHFDSQGGLDLNPFPTSSIQLKSVDSNDDE